MVIGGAESVCNVENHVFSHAPWESRTGRPGGWINQQCKWKIGQIAKSRKIVAGHR
jgi:hypothetical protein